MMNLDVHTSYSWYYYNILYSMIYDPWTREYLLVYGVYTTILSI